MADREADGPVRLAGGLALAVADRWVKPVVVYALRARAHRQDRYFRRPNRTH